MREEEREVGEKNTNFFYVSPSILIVKSVTCADLASDDVVASLLSNFINLHLI